MSPSMISLAALAAGAACAATAFHGANEFALLLWLANRVLAGLDGTHARVHGRQSDFGDYADTLTGTAVHAAVPAALIAADPIRLSLPGAFLLGALLLHGASRARLAALAERRQAGAVARGEQVMLAAPRPVVEDAETLFAAGAYATLLAAPSTTARMFWITGTLLLAGVLWRLAIARRRL